MSETELPAGSESYQPLIDRITVGGFKSLQKDQTVEVRPLTLLAGKNSAGKSSLMQPLLLLKQSLESAVEPPGGILLNGPNVKFTSASQLLSRGPLGFNDEFRLSLRADCPTLTYKKIDEHNIAIAAMSFGSNHIGYGMTKEGIYEELNKLRNDDGPVPPLDPQFVAPRFAKFVGEMPLLPIFPEMSVQRRRCFLELIVGKMSDWTSFGKGSNAMVLLHISGLPLDKGISSSSPVALALVHSLSWLLEAQKRTLTYMLSNIIHLPGLRGNPERQYTLTNWGDTFPGTFERYAASVLHGWQERNQPEMLARVEADLADLDLAHHVRARAKDGTSVEVEVKPGAESADDSEVVSLADVGLGVSQCLPVVVALHVAKPHQLVYLEQPEIHLHPRAQVKLAAVLARAVRRGVRMIVETHSDHLLLGIQTLVAQGELNPADVKLNWFEHNAKDRTTHIHGADVDDAGGFGAWPEDFSDVDMESRAAYLDATAARRRRASVAAT